MIRWLLLGLLVALPTWAERLELPSGRWSNGERPGFEVRVGDASTKSMSWDIDGLVLKGHYQVARPSLVLFRVDSMTADGQPATSGRIGAVKVRTGEQVRSSWDWSPKGVRLTVHGKDPQRLTVLLKKV